jgi:hypothetical protein
MGASDWPMGAPIGQSLVLVNGRYQILRGSKNGSRAKLGKETVAGAHRRPKWVPHYGAQDAQALLRLCSGMLTLGSGMLTLSSG